VSSLRGEIATRANNPDKQTRLATEVTLLSHDQIVNKKTASGACRNKIDLNKYTG